jgi:hypothetical protein
MKASTQYREFAEQCRRFAETANTEQQRKVLEEMARAWQVLAAEAEQKDRA